MSKKDEALKLALEALKQMQAMANFECWNLDICDEAITAIREALASGANEQPAQEDGPITEGWQITVAHGHSGYGVYAHMQDYPEEGAVLVQAIEQPAQGCEFCSHPLYAGTKCKNCGR